MMPAKWQQRIDLALLGVAIVCLGISLILKVYVSTLPQIGRVSLKDTTVMGKNFCMIGTGMNLRNIIDLELLAFHLLHRK